MNKMKKFFIICIFFVSALILAGCSYSDENRPEPTGGPTATPEPTATPAPLSFDAAAEMNRAELLVLSDHAEAAAYAEPENSENSAATEYAETLSAAVVDDTAESDVLCVDGEYIFALSDKTLTVFRVSGEAGETVSSTPIGTAWSSTETPDGTFTASERTPLGLFRYGSRLAVFLDVYGYDGNGSDVVYSEYVGVDFFDISDPAHPVLISSCGQDGVFSGAWMNGGVFCLATSYSVVGGGSAADGAIPKRHTGADSRALEIGNLYALPAGGRGCMVLGAYSLEDAAQKNTLAVYGGGSAGLYAVSGSVFLTDTRTVSAESRRMSDDAGNYTEYAELVCTDLFRFDYDGTGIRPAASGIVNGRLPKDNAIARFGAGYVCVSESSGVYTKLYDGNGGSVPAGADSGGALYSLDASLSRTAKLSELPDGGRIVWAGFTPDTVLLSGENGSYIADLSVPGTITAAGGGDRISADALLPWKDGGFAAFRHESAGQMVLSLYDSARRKTAERSFGSDYSSTLESLQSYIALPEKNLLGFAADDSYCLYAEQNGEIVFCLDVFLDDWAWNARAFEQNGFLCIADRHEVLIYLPDTLEKAASFTF